MLALLQDGEVIDISMFQPMYLDGYTDATRPGICMESLLSCIFFGVVESFMAEDCDCGNVKWVL